MERKVLDIKHFSWKIIIKEKTLELKHNQGKCTVCDWFVVNKLSIHFGQDKRKPILFGTKHKLWNAKSLNIVYNAIIEIKQHAKVKYVGCILDESFSGESMALNVINNINSRINCFKHEIKKYFLRKLGETTEPV